MLPISRDEFERYKELAQGPRSDGVLNTESLDEISCLVSSAVIYYNRLSSALAVLKDEIDQEYLIQKAKTDPATGKQMSDKLSQSIAEQKQTLANAISRREIEYLMESLANLRIAGKTRIDSLVQERWGNNANQGGYGSPRG